MFTEGLDEKAIHWVKQGTDVDQRPRTPLAERLSPCPVQDSVATLLYASDYLSPNRLPPLKFRSGLLGIHKTSILDLEDDSESVASADHNIDVDYSDTFDEEGLGSSDSDMFGKPSSVSYDDEVKSCCTERPTLVRTKSKENLKIDVNYKNAGLSSIGSHQLGFNDTYIEAHPLHKVITPNKKELGTPSAPPIMENLTKFEDERWMESNVDPYVSNSTQPTPCSGYAPTISKSKSSTCCEDLPNLETHLKDIDDPCVRDNTLQRQSLNNICPSKSTHQKTYHNASIQSAWQTFIAYDACFRLCLNAWARECMEAPEFLRDECSVLRDAFGLHKYLLQPRGQHCEERRLDNLEETCTLKEKKVVGKLKVEVRKVRIIPRRKLQSSKSLRALYMTLGTHYVRNVSALVKAGISSLQAPSFPIASEGPLLCFLQLKSSLLNLQKETDSTIQLHPGTGDSYVFYPESQADAILVEVQDMNKAIQGQATIHVSSLTDNHTDRIQWWPLYLTENECVGKIQLCITCSSTSSEMRSIKSGAVVETFVYDLVLEAAMRAQHFHSRNLHISGIWKWLLEEFADYYGVSDAYTKLRYLSYIMKLATPTKDCLELIYELLLPVIEARGERNLTRQERSLLLECETQVESLLATTFENYKSLDELSPTGLGDLMLHDVDSKFAAPAMVPAVQLFTLLHDILSQEAQNQLRNYFQTAALKRCRRHMVETDEFMSSNSDVISDPINVSTAYLKMKSLCTNISYEIQADIKIHNLHILPSSIDLPNITASVYSIQLCQRLTGFLKACPPSKPLQHVTELLITTADFERDLLSWNISPAPGGVISRDLFHDYIMVWIQDMRLHLLELCKAEKVPIFGTSTHYSTSPFVENMYDQIRGALNEYEIVIKRWPQYLLNLELAVSDVERAIVKALERQYTDILTPLRDSIPKKLEKQVQKLTRRQSVAIYSVPDQLGTFLNTVKRMIDILHGRVEDVMKSWASIMTILGDGRAVFGEQMNGITVMLRKKYKKYVQAIVEKLVGNTQANRCTRIKRILEETKEADGESEIRERMQTLTSQMADSICNLHSSFSSRIFVMICRSFWDKMGQIVLNFLESRKENRIWYKASEYALGILDDLFASQMQALLGNSLQEKDLDPPRSVIEARSILC